MTDSLKIETPGEIIKKLIFFNNINNSELASAIGVHPSTIGRLVDGGTKSPKDKLLIPIAEYFSLKLEQVKGLYPIPWETIKGAVTGTTRVPIYSWIKKDAWVQEINSTGVAKSIITDKALSENAYALQVKDSSMEPLFPKGTFVICEPAKEIKDRSYIIVRLGNLEAMIFRQVLVDGEHKFLKPLNQDLSNYKMRMMEDNDEYLGTVVQSKLDF